MSDSDINVDQFAKNDLLSIHQIRIPQTTLERLAQISGQRKKPEKIALRCIF